MQTRSIALLATALALAGIRPAQAQPPSPPTTRILAVGTVAPDADMAAVRALLPDEVRATVRLYLAGRIAQWYSQQGRTGVVFLLDMTDVAAAQAMLAQLPLGRAHLMTFALTPLGPLGPLRALPGVAASAPPP